MSGAGAHAGDGAITVSLDGFEDGVDLCGGFHGSVGEGADFAGNDGKAAACVSCAGCFNGSIEGEQVGLIGDLANYPGNHTDLGGAFPQGFDFDGGGTNDLG